MNQKLKKQALPFLYILLCFLIAFSCERRRTRELKLGVLDFYKNENSSKEGARGAFIATLTQSYLKGKIDFQVDEGENSVCISSRVFSTQQLESLLVHMKEMAEKGHHQSYASYVMSRVRFSKSRCGVKAFYSREISADDVISTVMYLPSEFSRDLSKVKPHYTLVERHDGKVVLRTESPETFYTTIYLKSYHVPEEALKALLSGEIDAFFPVPAFMARVLQGVKDIKLKTYPVRWMSYYLVFNPSQVNWCWMKKAFNLAVDRRRICERELGMEYKSSAVWGDSYDPVTSHKLLTRHRAKKTLRIAYPSWWTEGQRIIFYIKRDLFRVGVKVQVMGFNSPLFVRNSQGWDLMFMMSPLPHTRGGISFWCEEFARDFNPFAGDYAWCNSLLKARHISSLKNEIKECPPLIFLASTSLIMAISSDVKVPDEEMVFENIQKWR